MGGRTNRNKGRAVDVGEKFIPYATMFKIAASDVNGCHKVVECVNCRGLFPLSDLLSGELEENHCPACGVSGVEYWRDKPHQVVPPC